MPMRKSILALLAVASLLLVQLPATAEDPRSPASIPEFSEFNNLQLEPGQSGVFSFQLRNRYEGDITNLSLSIEIYNYVTIDGAEDPAGMENAPLFSDTSTLLESHFIPRFGPNATELVEVPVTTGTWTPEGTYFIRFALRFEYVNDTMTMLSLGHIDRDLWKKAIEGRDPDTGEVNITILGVDGIIPDSSFGVYRPIPMWPFYALVALTATVGILAVLFYMHETCNKVPWIEAAYQRHRARMYRRRTRLKGMVENVVKRNAGKKEHEKSLEDDGSALGPAPGEDEVGEESL